MDYQQKRAHTKQELVSAMFRPFCLNHRFAIGLLIAMLPIILLSACNPPTATTPPTPSPFVIVSPTAVPVSGKLIDQTPQSLLNIANSAPAQVGRFTLDKTKSYVAESGIELVYNANTGGTMSIAIWVTPSANLAEDRYSIETGQITAPKFPLAVGDESIASPSNKARGAQAGINPTVWGEMRFRNVVVELYPDGDLVQKMSDFRSEEATELLTKIFAVLPK